MYGGNIPLDAADPSKLLLDLAEQCYGPDCPTFDLPATGVELVETIGLVEGYFYVLSCSINLPEMVGTSGYVCDGLGIEDAAYCEDVAEVDPKNLPIREVIYPKLKEPQDRDFSKRLIADLIRIAKDPENPLNSVGITRK